MPNPKVVKEDIHGTGATGKKSKGNSYSDLKWVNPNINDADKDWLKTHVDDIADYVCELFESLSEGHTITSKYDSYTSRFLTTIVCNDAHSPNFGCAFSVRGATRVDSLYAAAYCHFVKYERVWFVDGGDALDRWG